MFSSYKKSFLSLKNAHCPSRRNILKGLALCFATSALSPFPRVAHAMTKKHKVLTVFFSKTGNTRALAQHIHAVVGGDVLELKTVHRYPDDHEATVNMAVQERRTNARPALDIPFSIDMDNYGTIFAGYPVWEYTMPMALFTFFEQYNFGGKTIIPFSTHQGSRLGNAPDDIAKLCPQATLLQGLAVRGPSARTAQAEVQQWVQSLGLATS